MDLTPSKQVPAAPEGRALSALLLGSIVTQNQVPAASVGTCVPVHAGTCLLGGCCDSAVLGTCVGPPPTPGSCAIEECSEAREEGRT